MTEPWRKEDNLRRTGRPKGSRNKKTLMREYNTNAAVVAISEGLMSEKIRKLSPLDVMLGVMHAQVASGDLAGAVTTAAQAAPYMHARIAAVQAETLIPDDLLPDPVTEGDEPGPVARPRASIGSDPPPTPDEPGPKNPIL